MVFSREKSHILSLNTARINSDIENFYGDYLARIEIANFKYGEIFYYTESIREVGISQTELAIEKIIKDREISIVFFAPHGDNYELSLSFFKRLKRHCQVKLVMWVLDDELIFDVFSKYYAQVLDAVITNDYYAVFGYEKLGVPALYCFASFSKKEYYPLNLKRDIDVSFVGDCTKNDRKELISFLTMNGVSVEAFGAGSKNGYISGKEMPVVFSRSKINLNFTKCNLQESAWFLHDNSLVNITRQNKGRPLEIAMTNSFCLSEYAPSLGVTFEIGTEIDVFYDQKDLLEKVHFYLKNEEVRRQIADRSYTKAIASYDADYLFPNLFEKLCAIFNRETFLSEREEIFVDRAFKINHMTRLTILFFYQLLTLKLRLLSESFQQLFQYGPVIFMYSFSRGFQIVLAKTIRKFLGKYKVERPKYRSPSLFQKKKEACPN